MLIDKIILSKTKYSKEEFTGGNIQYSVSKYTKKMSIKLVLYFGFNFNRNPISYSIEIQQKDVSKIINELMVKTKFYLNSLTHDEIFDLDSFVKDSYECSTTIVRGAPKDSDKEDRGDSNDSDTSPIMDDAYINDFFNKAWKRYTISFYNKSKSTPDRDRKEAMVSFKKVMKHNFKRVPKKQKVEMLIAYIDEEIKLQTKNKNGEFAKKFRKIFNIDQIEEYVNQELDEDEE